MFDRRTCLRTIINSLIAVQLLLAKDSTLAQDSASDDGIWGGYGFSESEKSNPCRIFDERTRDAWASSYLLERYYTIDDDCKHIDQNIIYDSEEVRTDAGLDVATYTRLPLSVLLGKDLLRESERF